MNGSEDDIIECKGEHAIEAVEKNGLALEYIREQTPEICIKAVENDGDALKYVRKQTPEICLKAVEKNSLALQYVDKSIFKPEETVVTK